MAKTYLNNEDVGVANGVASLDANGQIPFAQTYKALYSGMYMQDNPTNTIIAAADTPVKVAGITVAGLNSGEVTYADNRMTYTSAPSKTVHVVVTFTAFRVGSGSQDFSFFIAQNGVVLAKSTTQRQMNAQEASITVQVLTVLDTDDYLELWTENNTNSNDVRVEFMNFVMEEV